MKTDRTEINKLRYKLYEQRLTDNQVAEIEGCSVEAICGWRNRRGLPPNRRANFDVSAMPEWERKIIRDFIADLLCFCDKVGMTPKADGIGEAMNIWREKRRIA